MGVPKYAAYESEQKHGRGRHGDGGAEKHEVNDQEAGVAKPRECGNKLLHQEGDEQKENGAEIES